MKRATGVSRILLVSIHNSPELTGVGVYTGELANWLVRNGHKVHVVSASPFYPAWRPVGGLKNRYRITSEGGLTIFRAPLYIPGKLSTARRMLHLLSFALSSAPLLLAQVFWRPHVAIAVVPTYASAPLTWLVAKFCGARSVVHVQDFEVDAAFRITGNQSSTGRLQKLALRGESWLLRRFDIISTISARMLTGLIAKGAPVERTVLFRNWVDLDHIYPLSGSPAIRKELDIPPDAVVCLYSGNMGRKQGIDLLGELAARLRERKDIVFLFCGDGEMRPKLEADTAGLPNVRLIPLQPVERLNQLLNCADIHLLPQRRAAADLVLPSKLGGILASARPVVAGADPGTELADMIEGCGLVVPPEDAEAFAAALLKLADAPQLRQALGQKGRVRAGEKLSKQGIIGEFVSAVLGAGA